MINKEVHWASVLGVHLTFKCLARSEGHRRRMVCVYLGDAVLRYWTHQLRRAERSICTEWHAANRALTNRRNQGRMREVKEVLN